MNDVFHIMRIALDGTVLEDKAFDEIPCGTWDSEGTNDSMVYYSDVNVFTESPLTYNCLGIYKNTENTTIVVNHLIDENLNLIETIEYASYDPDAIFGPESFTFVSTLGAEASTRKTYLSTSMRSHNMTASTIIRQPPRCLAKICKQLTTRLFRGRRRKQLIFHIFKQLPLFSLPFGRRPQQPLAHYTAQSDFSEHLHTHDENPEKRRPRRWI